MDKKVKSGGSINNHSPSRLRSTTNHGTSNLLVRPTLCKSGAPTHNGSRSSSIKETNSSMSERTKRFLMSIKVRMPKLNQLLSLRPTMERDRNGMLSISIKLVRLNLKE
jgi:hypothetical protein